MHSVFNYLVEPKGSRSTGKKNIEGKELLLNTINDMNLNNNKLEKIISVMSSLNINKIDQMKTHFFNFEKCIVAELEF